MGETDKLDVIIAQLNELKGMPEKVNEVMDGFKNFRIEVNSWRNGVDASLNEVKQSLESSHAEMSVLKTSLGTKARYADFKTLRDDMYRENLRERISSHKQNLIFEGIDGAEHNKWETEGVIRDFWDKCMAIPENTAYGITIIDCHRLKPREGYPTAIIVKFAQLSDRDFVLNHAKNLKKYKVKTGSHERQQYFVQEHYPIELREQKKSLLPVFKQATKANMRRSWRVVGTQLFLYINKQKYEKGMTIPNLPSETTPDQAPKRLLFSDSPASDSK